LKFQIATEEKARNGRNKWFCHLLWTMFSRNQIAICQFQS